MNRLAWTIWSILILGIVIFFGWVISASAHDWYPNECCHDQDCFDITPGVDIIEQYRDGESGYYIPASKEWFGIERLRETPPEGRDHWARCASFSRPEMKTMLHTMPKVCIYRPPVRF